MKNFKQIIALFLISILLIGNLVSCKDETIKDPNKAFREKVGKIIKENPNANLNDLSLDGVTSLEGLFKDKNFTGDISGWDVSKVTNFKSMFEGSTFNGNISSWTPTAAQNMQFMFKNNTAFDQNLSSWQINADTTLFASIFKGAKKMLGTMDATRNSPAGTDKMPGVIKARYDKMVKPTGTSNEDLKSLMTTEIAKNGNDGDYNYIDTSDTVSFLRLFMNLIKFNGKINDWDTSNVTSMENTFYGANVFNQPLNNWDTSNVTNMYSMFNGARVFNQPIGNWDTSKVTHMAYMFYGANVFNQDLNAWNNKLTNATLLLRLNDNGYKENIFKGSGMQESNKPKKLRVGI